jgi:hypothetical protein
MSRARRPLPTDLVALVSFDGRVYPNEAKPWDRIGLDERARPLEEALEQWFFFATGKQTYVSVKGATIRGLINARPRGKRTAWEIEALIDADEDKGVVASLFSRMLEGIGRVGAERAFVRFDARSDMVRSARDAGFFPYQTQILYRLDAGAPGKAPDIGLRPKVKHETFGIFQLYMHSVPANVRAIEGATFKEWQAALEPWGGRTTDLVLNEDSAITAWARIQTGQTGRLLVHSASRSVTLDAVIAAATARLSKSEQVLALVPEQDVGMAAAFERLGYKPADSYVLMAKRLTKTSEELVRETTGVTVATN